MSKTKRFDIESNSPQGGATFQGNGTPININKAPSQSKRSARFGVVEGSPNGTTFQANKSFIDVPDADGKVLARKDIYSSSGQGHYSPPSNQLSSGSSYTGRPGIGGSSPKRGAMRPMKAFKV